MNIDYEVRPSTIPGAGRGLFALRHYHKNERVGIYRGKLLSPDDALRASKYTYFMLRPSDSKWKLEEKIIDGDCDDNDMRFINHKDDSPNCVARLLRNGSVCIYARRAIKPGEELFFDYGYSFK